jgi:hypothetical protein
LKPGGPQFTGIESAFAGQYPFRSIAEIFGHVSNPRAFAPDRRGSATAVSGFDQQCVPTAGVVGAFDIGDTVADQNGLAGIDAVLPARLLHQTR